MHSQAHNDSVMSQTPDYVRCDTPDPRVGPYQFDSTSPTRPQMDISSVWDPYGTNSSVLRGTPTCTLAHTVPSEFKWGPVTTTVSSHTQPLYSDGTTHLRHKRHWQSSDDRFYDDPPPPRKVHIDEQKVAQQFHSMSLHQQTKSPLSKPPNTDSSMWNHFYELENKLDNLSDVEIDEGVDMGGDIDSKSQPNLSNNSELKLHLSDDLRAKIKTTPLPQIMVPKPCKELVVWQPSGIEQIKESVILQTTPTSATSASAVREFTSRRVKKMAARSLSAGASLLSVPAVRPDTPPPKTSKSPVSQDIPVCFIEDPSSDVDMDL